MIREEEIKVEISGDIISEVRNIGIARDEKAFLLGFNRDGEQFEKVFRIPADKLQEIIIVLFQSGVKFQSETNIDIGFGFGVGEMDDENTNEG